MVNVVVWSRKIYNLSPLERSEKDRVLLHLQFNSQKISDFLRSRGAIREAEIPTILILAASTRRF
jgi:hypothetical protein